MFFKKKSTNVELKKYFYIIDDEEDIVELLDSLLNDLYSCEVKTFNNADEALSYLDSDNKAPDVILSDVRMPGTSGFRLHSEIESRNLDIPIVLITGLSGDEIFEGKRIVISKPFNAKKIKGIIDGLV